MRFLSLLLTILCTLWTMPDVGAGVLDPLSQLTIRRSAPAQSRSDDDPATHVGAIIQISEETSVDNLRALGCEIVNRRDDLLLVAVPVDAVDALDRMDGIMAASVASTAAPALAAARPYAGAQAVQAGAVSDLTLDGSGVTVGMVDAGFDPSHPAFAGRVREFTRYDAAHHRLTYPDATDRDDMWHATHVAGIMCGNPPAMPDYRGIATGAGLVAVGAATLCDMEILAGVERIIASAREAGQPAVVNLSLSSSIGPRDGSTLFCRYLDRCADDALIVISAGNTGANPATLQHTFTADRPVAATIFRLPGDKSQKDGYIDAWSTDNRPVRVRFTLYDSRTNTDIAYSPWLEVQADGQVAELSLDDIPGLGAHITGSILYAGEVSPLNGRYNLICAVVAGRRDSDSRYTLGIQYTAEAGTTVDASTSGIDFDIHRGPDAVICTSRLSYNDLACGRRTLGVGSINTATGAMMADGHYADWSGATSQRRVSVFSSYGTLRDGRIKPDVLAPGAVIISAMSEPHLAADPVNVRDLCFRDSDGVPYGADAGTSMSAPHVAGICALWLQADPTLSAGRLIEIATATADMSLADESDLRSGAHGCIDAVAGLRRIIGDTGIRDIASEPLIIDTSGPAVTVRDVYGNDVPFTLYDTAGRTVGPSARGILILRTPWGTHRICR